MSENKFIKHLKGEDTAKSVLEIKNQRTTTSFANMPAGTSNANDVCSDNRGNATGVLRGSDNWKLSGLGTLIDSPTVYGDGRDFIDSYDVLADSLWVDATYTFSASKIFSPNTKFVLKLCGERLSNTEDTVPFSLIITIGNAIITKSFVIREHAFTFSEEFVIDFAESNATTLKCAPGTTMRVQLLCGAPNASATLYYGMTVFTALQRRVDADVVASDEKTFEEVVQDIIDINDDIDQIHEDIDDLEEYVDDTFVRLDGTSIMTAPLKFAAGSMRGAVGPYLNGVSFWKMSAQYTITNIANLTDSQFLPVTTNAIDLGRSANKWKDLYLGGKAYVATLNNGADLTVPNKSGTLATMGDVELAARSGRMLTDQGVWYAKMYSATVPPAAENGTNYADFSQVDGDNNPIIVIYERQSGAWVQTETITPPAEYDGYVPITSKIWDIPEQAGQQGGRVLWNHQSKEFTPYPQIISFEDIEVTGTSTVIMPYSPSANQIVNKNYVDTLVSNSIGNATITLTQGGQTMGSFTTNQSGDATIALDGGSSYHPDLFDWKWADHQLNDVQWLRADTFSWQAGSVYESAYQHLADDIDGKTLQSETIGNTTIQFYLADDGHKICPASEESNVVAIYNATGVAWYYIIDTVNERFKLPRTQFGVTGLRDTVGNYVAPGLPNITGKFAYDVWQSASYDSGAFYNDGGNKRRGTDNDSGSSGGRTAFDASRSSAIYGASTTVQPPATQMYLYFYVGEFTQTALENTAGITAETLNDKVDVGHQVIAFQAPTAGNNYTWYRKYADGWVEQGGYNQNNAMLTTVTLPIPIADTYYTATANSRQNGYTSAPDGVNRNTVMNWAATICEQTTTTLSIRGGASESNYTGYNWRVEGMAAA